MATIGDANSSNNAAVLRSVISKNSGDFMPPTTGKSTMAEYEPPPPIPEKEKGLVQSLRSYPKGVFFMLGNEFCERFSFYGMRAILVIFLTTVHGLEDREATQYYHMFISLAYFSPLFGSVLADNYFGRFRVILWVSLVYVFGHILLSVGAVPQFDVVLRHSLDYSGLAVIALATGGIKPCVSAFAADQFGDHQHRERTQFFSFFYFAINAGSLVAMAVTPRLRTIHCMGDEHCFPLAFGVPAVLMFLAFLTFMFGWRYYKITPANKGNILWKVVQCTCFALKRKLANTFSVRGRSHRRKTPDHWLDYAATRYDEHLITGVKSILAIMLLYIPIVFFWALYDQQGSTWVLQAQRMDGRIGWFTILPDQMNTFNPLFVLILVPIFEAWFYPLMNRLLKVTPLRKMATGALLAAVAFSMAGFLQIKVSDTMEPQPDSGKVFIQRLGNYWEQFEVVNSMEVQLPIKHDNIPLKVQIPVGNYSFVTSGNNGINTFNFTLNLATEEPKSRVVGLFQQPYTETEKPTMVEFPYSTEKTKSGKTRFYFLLLLNSELNGTQCYLLDDSGWAVANSTVTNGGFIDLQPGFLSTSAYYNLTFGNCTDDKERPVCDQQIRVNAHMGAAYVVDLMTLNEAGQLLQPIELVRPNSVSILWQLPQLFVMTVGEILLSVTGLEFSYSQAAPSMKSVVQALWLLTVFFGNVFDVVFAEIPIHDPVMQLFLYAGLMFIVVALFILLAMGYKYVDEHAMDIPDTPERQRRESSDDGNDDDGGSGASNDDRAELGGATNNLPQPTLIEKKDRN